MRAEASQGKLQADARSLTRMVTCTRIWMRGIQLALVTFLLLWCQTGAAQHDASELQLQKLGLEIEKLKEDIKKLRTPIDWDKLLTVAFGLASGAAGYAVAFWLARRNRQGDLDQATHEKRLEYYPQLVKATAPLALYFVGGPSLDPAGCSTVGREMSIWYFEQGGLLLSREARDAYFRLARALTRGSLEPTLKVPNLPNDAGNVSSVNMKSYQDALQREKLDLDDVEEWSFGPSPLQPGGGSRELHLEFKDYVFLQRLSSLLRTELSKDLGSRRRTS